MKYRIYFLFLPLFAFSMISEISAQNARPNIVLIISDDHAYQTISAYGYDQVETPQIDRIADEGMRLDRAYVTNSICGPSRATILTGKYSHINGFKDNATSNYNSSQFQFVNGLQDAGYQTAWIGKYHLGDDPQGFDFFKILIGQGHYFNPDFILPDGSRPREEGYVADLIEDAAEEWLEERDKEKPFCLIIGHKNTHRVWMPALEDMGKYDDIDFSLPDNFYDNYEGRKAAQVQDMSIEKTLRLAYDLKMYPEDTNDGNVTRMTPEQREVFDAYYKPIKEEFESLNLTGDALTEWKYQRYMKDYLATAFSMDRNIGRTLDYLDENGLSDNTIVIYMSDQGFFMGEHGWFDKRFMYTESFRTPMIIRWPGQLNPGSTSDAMVLNLDIAPSLLEAGGAEIPKDLQGFSFWPALKGEKKGRDRVYYHYYEYGEHSVSPHFGIQSGHHKLIRFYNTVESWELFDLEKDPHEMNNLYGKKGYDRLTKKLKKQLKKEIKKFGDEEAMVIFEETISDKP